jgi:hypothetical protein
MLPARGDLGIFHLETADRIVCATQPKKCYKFMLAMPVAGAAYCVSNRTATLLLVVDWYSQVLGAAVHHYSHLIRNLNPSSSP